MSNQTSLVTESARSAAIQNTVDYTDSIAQHISGEWSEHNQVAVHDTPYPITVIASGGSYAAHVVTDAKCLRFLVTLGSTDISIIVPGIPMGVYSGGGTGSGAPGATAPAFTLNPVGGSFTAGSSVTLTVAYTGTAPIILQWTKNGSAISGAISTSYTISSFQAADAGNYACVTTNSVGRATSTTAALAIKTTGGGEVPVREEDTDVSGGCFTRNTFITLANGVQQPISALVQGNALRSYDIKGLDSTNELSFLQFSEPTIQATVVETTITKVFKRRYHYYYVLNGELEATMEHPILVKRGNAWVFKAISQLRIGDYLFKNGSAVLLRSIDRVDGGIETWNLDVEPYDVYLANGFAVHNTYIPIVLK